MVLRSGTPVHVIAKVFKYLTSNLDRKISHSTISPFNFLEAPVVNSFFFPPTGSEKIVNLIRRQGNKSTDLMNISEFYKFIFNFLSPLIFLAVSMLINNALQEGIFVHECFKTAKIIPIFKSCHSNSTANNWPFSACISCQKYL